MGPELEDLVETHRMPGVLMMIWRACTCLSGTGDAIGLLGASPSKMLLPSAKAHLARRGLLAKRDETDRDSPGKGVLGWASHGLAAGVSLVSGRPVAE